MSAAFKLSLPPGAGAPSPPRDRAPDFGLLADSRDGARRSLITSISLVAHGVLAASLLVLPLLSEDGLITPHNIRAFLVAPPSIQPPPPPPPPAAAAAKAALRRAVPTAAPPRESAFIAPSSVQALATEEPPLDLGVLGGEPGGVEGGIEGGVAGGVVGGILAATATPAPIRVGGNIKAPSLVRRVNPAYPQLARQARVSGQVVIEALVDTNGFVRNARITKGIPLLDQAALAAVRGWRYQPLLLNGMPCDFILTVTVDFSLVSSTP